MGVHLTKSQLAKFLFQKKHCICLAPSIHIHRFVQLSGTHSFMSRIMGRSMARDPSSTRHSSLSVTRHASMSVLFSGLSAAMYSAISTPAESRNRDLSNSNSLVQRDEEVGGDPEPLYPVWQVQGNLPGKDRHPRTDR